MFKGGGRIRLGASRVPMSTQSFVRRGMGFRILVWVGVGNTSGTGWIYAVRSAHYSPSPTPR